MRFAVYGVGVGGLSISAFTEGTADFSGVGEGSADGSAGTGLTSGSSGVLGAGASEGMGEGAGSGEAEGLTSGDVEGSSV